MKYVESRKESDAFIVITTEIGFPPSVSDIDCDGADLVQVYETTRELEEDNSLFTKKVKCDVWVFRKTKKDITKRLTSTRTLQEGDQYVDYQGRICEVIEEDKVMREGIIRPLLNRRVDRKAICWCKACDACICTCED